MLLAHLSASRLLQIPVLAINLFNLVFSVPSDFFAFCLARNDDFVFGFLLKSLLDFPSLFILKIFAKILKKHWRYI